MENINWNLKGKIFNIQRFSLHDGDGIRTIVFFKGCSLRCKWCSNPESQSLKQEILFKEMDCIKCNKCAKVCKNRAINIINGKITINHKLCTGCGECVKVCCSDALQLVGEERTVKDIFEEVIKDKVFYEESGGGITLSGGEASLQPDFAAELLKACKENNINTAIETAGNVPMENIIKIMPYIDTFLYDIKIVDPEIHKIYTGASNEKLMKNLCLLVKSNKNVIIRIPVIQDINTTEQNMEKLLSLLEILKTIKEVHLLPYHKYGVNKYGFLGRDYSLKDKEYVDKEKLNWMRKKIEEKGYKCKIGG